MNAITTEMHNRAPDPQQTLVEMENAYAAATGLNQFYKLRHLPWAAFNAGDLSKAQQYARSLLAAADRNKSDLFYGDAIFEADTILGRVALRNGDVTAANHLLVASVGTGTYAWLSASGPDMGLAQELLARGERDTVTRFLSICKTFWKNDKGNLDVWSAAIQGGATPVLRPRRDK
jgi:hypothetical protein